MNCSECKEATFYWTASKYNIALRYQYISVFYKKNLFLILYLWKYILHSLHNKVSGPCNAIFKTKILQPKLTPKSRQW
jgi:hypothetical protein